MKNIKHNIYWVTGQSGSGKTTLAYALQKEIGGVILDGDKMRESISLGAGFSKEEREEHNLRVARLALVLSDQLPVIVSVIAPFESTRQIINELIKPIWIYVAHDFTEDLSRPYEVPKNSHIVLNSDNQSVEEEILVIMNYIK
jgi:adenylylsulfate kinase-like enzyme